jgi:hypothetical protein
MVCEPYTVGWEADNVPQLAGWGVPGLSTLKKGVTGAVGAVGGVAKGAGGFAWKAAKGAAKLGAGGAGLLAGAIAAANKPGAPPPPEDLRRYMVKVPVVKSWWAELLEAIGLG